MENYSAPRILLAERLDNAVIVTFDNDACGLYSAALLYAILPQAETVEVGNQADDPTEQ